MLRGRHEHSVDPKGRIAMPANFRSVLHDRYGDGRVVVTKHLTDPCLVVYPLPEWEKLEERIAALPQFDPNAKLLRRIYIGGAQECSLDKQGRLQLRVDIREDANIDGEVIWNGQVSFAELWSKPNYENLVESQKAKLAAGGMPELEKQLADLGI